MNTTTDITAFQDKTPLYIYFLYLAGLFVAPAALIGVVMAYINRGTDPSLDSHYSSQIKTFWIGLAVLFVGFLLTIVIVGYLVLLAWFVWVIIKCVKGIKAFNAGQAI